MAAQMMFDLIYRILEDLYLNVRKAVFRPGEDCHTEYGAVACDDCPLFDVCSRFESLRNELDALRNLISPRKMKGE